MIAKILGGCKLPNEMFFTWSEVIIIKGLTECQIKRIFSIIVRKAHYDCKNFKQIEIDNLN